MCFHAAVGQIRYSVLGARCLFDLLPGVSYVSESFTTNIILPELSTSNFSRFEFYAPLVKRLEIFDEYYDQDAIFDYTINCYEPILDAESTLALVANLALRCLLLEDLSLYVSFDNSPDQHGSLIPLLLPIYEYLGRMQNLQILRTNLPIFEAAALPALGRLPRLDTLEISQVYSQIFPMEGVSLPDNLFPSLRKLCLPMLEIEEFKAIWGIRQLADRLVVLEIEFDELEFENDADTLLNDICQNGSQLVDLTIGFCSTAHVFSTFFRPSKQLSLEKLSISGIDFHHIDIIYKTLSSTCPWLCELRLPGHRISISDLRYFSHLARLEHLSIFVAWDSCIELNESVPKPLRVSPAFQTLEGSRISWNLLEPALAQKTVLLLLTFHPRLNLHEKRKSLTTSNHRPSTPGLVKRRIASQTHRMKLLIYLIEKDE
ncbi:hypothetical protein BDV93DRAFT_579248 [Ceratobasidium sp. AG-I]|nr:hypothetical protein BDV93DRAFT_579248 [Ceratobasidium sp. AG-I]